MENNILKYRMAVMNNIAKSFGYEKSEDLLEKSEDNDIEKAKHQDGDMHPNGKWVWRASANGGKGDWRVAKTGSSKATTGGTSSATTKTNVSVKTHKSSNTVTHDINGMKVTVTKNSDGSYTLEANGKKVKSDDPSFFVNGTNLKPRVKAALAKEVGLEMKKDTMTNEQKAKVTPLGNPKLYTELSKNSQEKKDLITLLKEVGTVENEEITETGISGTYKVGNEYINVTGTSVTTGMKKNKSKSRYLGMSGHKRWYGGSFSIVESDKSEKFTVFDDTQMSVLIKRLNRKK